MIKMKEPARSFGIDTGPGIRINCFEMGQIDGPPIVILHGLAGSSREFFETARALPEFKPS